MPVPRSPGLSPTSLTKQNEAERINGPRNAETKHEEYGQEMKNTVICLNSRSNLALTMLVKS